MRPEIHSIILRCYCEHRENIISHSSGHKTMLCFAQMKLRQAANDVMLRINDVGFALFASIPRLTLR